MLFLRFYQSVDASCVSLLDRHHASRGPFRGSDYISAQAPSRVSNNGDLDTTFRNTTM